MIDLEDSLVVSSIANESSLDLSETPNGTIKLGDNEDIEQNDSSKQSEEKSSIFKEKEKSVKNSVVIHVCDESRNLSKRFECNKQLLINKMTYFSEYLREDMSEEVDISVHCDILVFEWLISYISNQDNNKLEIHNVVSILISSHFLKMKSLVSECIDFMSSNLNEIIQLPLDLSCLNNELIRMIASKLDVFTIDLVDDPADKIVSSLYKHHLEIFISQKMNKLYRCVYCGQLYTRQQRKKLICYKSPIYINFNGETIRKHSAESGWYISKYLLGLRLQSYSWKEIYWYLWSLTRIPVYCYLCNEYITVTKLYHCSFHISQPIRNINDINILYYPCCKTKENNFNIVNIQKTGCQNKQHQIDNNNEMIKEILNIVSTHSQYVLIPFEYSSNNNNNDNKRPQSATADHRSRFNIHSSRYNNNGNIKRVSSNNHSSSLKTTGVWDAKYFVFGCQTASKSLNIRNHHNNKLNFDIYHKKSTFWYKNNKNKQNNDDITTGDSFQYLSYLLTFDNIDIYGEGDDDQANNNNNNLIVDDKNHIECDQEEEEEDLLTDECSVNSEDAHDVLHASNNPTSSDTSDLDIKNNNKDINNNNNNSPKNKNKKKSKAIPVRGRRLKAMSSKGRFSVNVKQTQRSSSTFDIQQNDIRRLDALMRSLSENRQN